MKITRRNLLKLSTLTAGGYFLNPLFSSVSLADLGSSRHFFVLFGVTPTMDCTLGLDPLVHSEYKTTQADVFLEYSPSQIYRQNKIALGPAAEPLFPYAKDIAIVNGIHMRQDIGHDLRHIASGSGDGMTADFATELNVNLYSGKKGVLASNSVINGMRTPLVTNLSSIVNSSTPDTLDPLFWQTQGSLGQVTSKTSVSESDFTNDEFNQLQKVISELEAKGFARNSHTFAAACMSLGLSYQAFLEPINFANLDSHIDHEKNHLQNQKSVWAEVAELFKIFKSLSFGGGTLFDHTTFMVCTDMSRTPFLNDSKGKDHNHETNSVLLAGKGIVKGAVIGKSKVFKKDQSHSFARHIGLPLDYKTGLPVLEKRTDMTDIKTLYPENLIMTLAELFDKEKLYTEKRKDIPTLKGLVRS